MGLYGSAATNGGIYIGRENPRTWVFNNLIRANGRNGVLIDCGVENAPKYFVNNTIVQNGFNGLFVGDSLKDEIFLVNNLDRRQRQGARHDAAAASGCCANPRRLAPVPGRAPHDPAQQHVLHEHGQRHRQRHPDAR